MLYHHLPRHLVVQGLIQNMKERKGSGMNQISSIIYYLLTERNINLINYLREKKAKYIYGVNEGRVEAKDRGGGGRLNLY